MVQLLLDEDPSYSYRQNKRGETPLYIASARGYNDMVGTILCKCESPTFGGPDGRTALHAAVLVDDGHGKHIYSLPSFIFLWRPFENMHFISNERI